MRRETDVDEARLRPHLRVAAVKAEKVDRARSERAVGKVVGKVPTGDDWQRMRGLPMIAPGVAGVQRGTDPLREAIKRDEQRRP